MLKSIRKRRKQKNTLVLILFSICFLGIYYAFSLHHYVFPIIGEAMALASAYLAYQVYLHFLYQSSNFYLLATTEYKNDELRTLLYLGVLALILVITILMAYGIVGTFIVFIGLAFLLKYSFIVYRLKLGFMLLPYVCLINVRADFKGIVFLCCLVGMILFLDRFKFKNSIIFELDGDCIASSHQSPLYLHETDQSMEISETSIEVIDADDYLHSLKNIDIAPNDIPSFIDWIKLHFVNNEIAFFYISDGERKGIN